MSVDVIGRHQSLAAIGERTDKQMPGLTHFPVCTNCGLKNGHTDDCPNKPKNPWIEDELEFLATLLAEPEIMNSRTILNLCCERAVKLKAIRREGGRDNGN